LYRAILDEAGIEPLWFVKTRKPFAKRLTGVATSASLRNCAIISEDAADLYQNPYQRSEQNYHSRTNTGISIYAMFMALLALEKSYRHICLGNERSAEDGNCLWDGVVVNHQFDKGATYRAELSDYIRKYICPSLNLFSIFESYYEYNLAQAMRAAGPLRFKNMTSCNYLTDQQAWCHRCPKCAWSFAVLASAFGKEFAITVVGKNLFDDPGLYEAVLDPRMAKPFECIGERPEIWLILEQCVEQGQTGKVLDVFCREYRSWLQRHIRGYREKYQHIYSNPAVPEFVAEALASRPGGGHWFGRSTGCTQLVSSCEPSQRAAAG